MNQRFPPLFRLLRLKSPPSASPPLKQLFLLRDRSHRQQTGIEYKLLLFVEFFVELLDFSAWFLQEI